MENFEPALSGSPRRRPRWAHFGAALGAASAGLATLVAIGGPAAASGTGTLSAQLTSSSRVVVSEVTLPKYGKVLIDQKGLALYYDTANKPKIFACTGDCLTAWPPLVLKTGQTLVAGKGVSDLGTVRGPSGLQVTWEGKPLYTFVEDSKGKVTGQGVGHVWFVAQLSASAKAPAKAPASAPTTVPAPVGYATSPSTSTRG